MKEFHRPGCVAERLQPSVHGDSDSVSHFDSIKAVIVAQVADSGDCVKVVDPELAPLAHTVSYSRPEVRYFPLAPLYTFEH